MRKKTLRRQTSRLSVALYTLIHSPRAKISCTQTVRAILVRIESLPCSQLTMVIEYTKEMTRLVTNEPFKEKETEIDTKDRDSGSNCPQCAAMVGRRRRRSDETSLHFVGFRGGISSSRPKRWNDQNVYTINLTVQSASAIAGSLRIGRNKGKPEDISQVNLTANGLRNTIFGRTRHKKKKYQLLFYCTGLLCL